MMLISSSSILASQGMWASLLYLAHPCLSLFSACLFSLLFLLWYGFFFFIIFLMWSLSLHVGGLNCCMCVWQQIGALSSLIKSCDAIGTCDCDVIVARGHVMWLLALHAFHLYSCFSWLDLYVIKISNGWDQPEQSVRIEPFISKLVTLMGRMDARSIAGKKVQYWRWLGLCFMCKWMGQDHGRDSGALFLPTSFFQALSFVVYCTSMTHVVEGKKTGQTL